MSAKQIWKDPVGAAVIAGLILTALGWASEKLSSNLKLVSQTLPIPVWLLTITVSIIVGTLWRLVQHTISSQQVYAFEPEIAMVGVYPNMASPGAGLTYPLKCSVSLRNDSKGCLDLMLAGYEENTIPIKKFVQGVLQIEANAVGWIPTDHGADRIAVHPAQNFRVWFPIDETKYTADEVRGAKGQIGTLVLKANGRNLRISV